MKGKQNIIIYNTADGKASVSLYAKDGMVWMNQNQLAELFATSKQNIGQHIINILKDRELEEDSVVKNYFTTAADGKEYKVTFYALEMVLAIGFRVRGLLRGKFGTRYGLLYFSVFTKHKLYSKSNFKTMFPIIPSNGAYSSLNTGLYMGPPTMSSYRVWRTSNIFSTFKAMVKCPDVFCTDVASTQ